MASQITIVTFTQERRSTFSLNNTPLIAEFEHSNKEVNISVRAGAKTINFKLQPNNRRISLPISNIIESIIEENYSPNFEELDTYITLPSVYIYAQQIDSSIEFAWGKAVIKGGYNQSAALFDANILSSFLTWRPQIESAYFGIKQQLSFCLHYKGAVWVRLYFQNEQPIEQSLIPILQGVSYLHRVDVSVDRMIALAEEKNINDILVAYDVWFKIEGIPFSKHQRFIIQRENSSYSHFFFQNSLGGFDTITATGELKSIPKGESLTFTNTSIESELPSDFNEEFEVNTGIISTAQERNLWYEFLKSTNKYLLSTENLYRKIVVSEYKAEHTYGKTNSYTFKYRYSEADTGSYFSKITLDNNI